MTAVASGVTDGRPAARRDRSLRSMPVAPSASTSEAGDSRGSRAASSAAETDDSFKSMGGLFHPALSPRPVWGARQVPPGLPRLDLATVMRKNAKEPETSDDKRAPAPRIEAQHASAEARALSRVLQEARSRPRGGADVPTRQQRGRSVEGAPRSRPGALPQGQTWKVLDPVVAGTRSVSQQPSGGSMGRFAPPPATSGDTGVAIAGSNAARSVGHGHNRDSSSPGAPASNHAANRSPFAHRVSSTHGKPSPGTLKSGGGYASRRSSASLAMADRDQHATIVHQQAGTRWHSSSVADERSPARRIGGSYAAKMASASQSPEPAAPRSPASVDDGGRGEGQVLGMVGGEKSTEGTQGGSGGGWSFTVAEAPVTPTLGPRSDDGAAPTVGAVARADGGWHTEPSEADAAAEAADGKEAEARGSIQEASREGGADGVTEGEGRGAVGEGSLGTGASVPEGVVGVPIESQRSEGQGAMGEGEGQGSGHAPGWDSTPGTPRDMHRSMQEMPDAGVASAAQMRDAIAEGRESATSSVEARKTAVADPGSAASVLPLPDAHISGHVAGPVFGEPTRVPVNGGVGQMGAGAASTTEFATGQVGEVEGSGQPGRVQSSSVAEQAKVAGPSVASWFGSLLGRQGWGPYMRGVSDNGQPALAASPEGGTASPSTPPLPSAASPVPSQERSPFLEVPEEQSTMSALVAQQDHPRRPSVNRWHVGSASSSSSSASLVSAVSGGRAGSAARPRRSSRIPSPGPAPRGGESPERWAAGRESRLRHPGVITPLRFRALRDADRARDPRGNQGRNSPMRRAALQLDSELQALLGPGTVLQEAPRARSASQGRRRSRRRLHGEGEEDLPAASPQALPTVKDSPVQAPPPPMLDAGEPGLVAVAARVRPLLPVERGRGALEVVSTGTTPGDAFVLCGEGHGRMYRFPAVFGPRSTQREVYDRAVAGAVAKCAEGFTCTVVAYGQTGSGKTFTMGTGPELFDGWRDAAETGLRPETVPESCGVLPRALAQLFAHIRANRARGVATRAQCRFVEIYNEEIRDLLDPRSLEQQARWGARGHAAGLSLKDQPDGSVAVVGCSTIEVHTAEEALRVFAAGIRHRTTGQTAVNDRSSRSHALLSILLESLDASGATILSALHLVDLAGSERNKATDITDIRLKEAVSINQGLLALGNVISALSDQGQGDRGTRQRHIPYRDSKLTRLLREALGGNSYTVMLCCVSSADVALHETQNTLKYATRASTVQNHVSRVILRPGAVAPERAAQMRSLQQFLDNADDLGASVPDLTGFGNDVLWSMLRKLRLVAHRHRERADAEGRRAAVVEEERRELEAQIERERTRVARLARAMSVRRASTGVKDTSSSPEHAVRLGALKQRRLEQQQARARERQGDEDSSASPDQAAQSRSVAGFPPPSLSAASPLEEAEALVERLEVAVTNGSLPEEARASLGQRLLHVMMSGLSPDLKSVPDARFESAALGHPAPGRSSAVVPTGIFGRVSSVLGVGAWQVPMPSDQELASVTARSTHASSQETPWHTGANASPVTPAALDAFRTPLFGHRSDTASGAELPTVFGGRETGAVAERSSADEQADHMTSARARRERQELMDLDRQIAEAEAELDAAMQQGEHDLAALDAGQLLPLAARLQETLEARNLHRALSKHGGASLSAHPLHWGAEKSPPQTSMPDPRGSSPAGDAEGHEEGHEEASMMGQEGASRPASALRRREALSLLRATSLRRSVQSRQQRGYASASAPSDGAKNSSEKREMGLGNRSLPVAEETGVDLDRLRSGHTLASPRESPRKMADRAREPACDGKNNSSLRGSAEALLMDAPVREQSVESGAPAKSTSGSPLHERPAALTSEPPRSQVATHPEFPKSAMPRLEPLRSTSNPRRVQEMQSARNRGRMALEERFLSTEMRLQLLDDRMTRTKRPSAPATPERQRAASRGARGTDRAAGHSRPVAKSPLVAFGAETVDQPAPAGRRDEPAEEKIQTPGRPGIDSFAVNSDSKGTPTRSPLSASKGSPSHHDGASNRMRASLPQRLGSPFAREGGGGSNSGSKTAADSVPPTRAHGGSIGKKTSRSKEPRPEWTGVAATKPRKNDVPGVAMSKDTVSSPPPSQATTEAAAALPQTATGRSQGDAPAKRHARDHQGPRNDVRRSSAARGDRGKRSPASRNTSPGYALPRGASGATPPLASHKIEALTDSDGAASPETWWQRPGSVSPESFTGPLFTDALRPPVVSHALSTVPEPTEAFLSMDDASSPSQTSRPATPLAPGVHPPSAPFGVAQSPAFVRPQTWVFETPARAQPVPDLQTSSPGPADSGLSADPSRPRSRRRAGDTSRRSSRSRQRERVARAAGTEGAKTSRAGTPAGRAGERDALHKGGLLVAAGHVADVSLAALPDTF